MFDKYRYETLKAKMNRAAEIFIALYKGNKARKIYKRKREGTKRLWKPLALNLRKKQTIGYSNIFLLKI